MDNNADAFEIVADAFEIVASCAFGFARDCCDSFSSFGFPDGSVFLDDVAVSDDADGMLSVLDGVGVAASDDDVDDAA